MCFSGNPLSSTIFGHVWNILVVYSMLSLSVSDSLNHFPKHILIRFHTVDGISLPWICILTSLLTWPLIQDIFRLNFIHTRQRNAIFQRWTDPSCLYIWVVVVAVRSSMKSLIGGWWIPEFIIGRIPIPITNRIGEIVHPMNTPFSTLCQNVAKSSTLNWICIPPIILNII